VTRRTARTWGVETLGERADELDVVPPALAELEVVRNVVGTNPRIELRDDDRLLARLKPREIKGRSTLSPSQRPFLVLDELPSLFDVLLAEVG